MLLTLLVLPAGYAIWRRHQVRVALAADVEPGADRMSEGAA
jgi:hypothetical protein